MIAGIYQIVHVESGRRYIGSSINVNLRLRKHRAQLRRGSHTNPSLQNAWLTHGEGAFEFKPLLICRPDDLVMYENATISAYKANVKPHGYNHRIAAESNRGMESSRLKHRAGNKYGRLTLISLAERLPGGNKWLCSCDCGNQTTANVSAAKYGAIRSCGCLKTEILRGNRARRPGEKFNRMTLVSRVGVNKHGSTTWLCRCDCGVEKVTPSSPIVAGRIQSCGCLLKEALSTRTPYHAGQKYNRLTLIERAGRDGRGKILWRCKCDCGGEVIATGARVGFGKVKSCGCYRREDSRARSLARHAANRLLLAGNA